MMPSIIPACRIILRQISGAREREKVAEGTIECVGCIGVGGDCGDTLHCQEAMTQLAEAFMIKHTHTHTQRHCVVSESRKSVKIHVDILHRHTTSSLKHRHVHKDRAAPKHYRLIMLPSSLT